MPTVHLSLPDSTYRELKKRANDMGIQVTDLIKLYIKLGLERGFTTPTPTLDNEVVARLASRLDRVEKEHRMKMTLLEGKYRQLEEMISYILERVEVLEDILTSAKSTGKIVSKPVYEEG